MIIQPACTADDLAAIATLFEAYAASLEIDLGYQDFAAELASLPGRYAPPRGALLIARSVEGGPLGCIALRPLADPARCEMKRLSVAPAARGSGLGRLLVEAVIAEAKRIGYEQMWLDTLRSMSAAQALYRQAGFEPAEPYYETPVVGTVFMRLSL